MLLDTAFYRKHLSPVVAKWALLWICKVSFDDLEGATKEGEGGVIPPIDKEVLLGYLTGRDKESFSEAMTTKLTKYGRGAVGAGRRNYCHP